MFVRIIKLNKWYRNTDFLSAIYEVEPLVHNAKYNQKVYYLKDTCHNKFILEEDCEIVNFNKERKSKFGYDNLAKELIQILKNNIK